MRPTTHSYEPGRSMAGSVIPSDSTPGSIASSSTPVEIGFVEGSSDATTIWIEQLDVATPDAHHLVDDRDAIGRAFAALSPDHRIAVVLRYYRDLPVEEVARAVGAPIGTVRSRLHYALRHLRSVLGEEGGFR